MKSHTLSCTSKASPAPSASAASSSFVSSKDLLGNHSQVRIEHEGEVYYLRLTKLNKLILTK